MGSASRHAQGDRFIEEFYKDLCAALYRRDFDDYQKHGIKPEQVRVGFSDCMEHAMAVLDLGGTVWEGEVLFVPDESYEDRRERAESTAELLGISVEEVIRRLKKVNLL